MDAANPDHDDWAEAAFAWFARAPFVEFVPFADYEPMMVRTVDDLDDDPAFARFCEVLRT